ncbi:tRNA pseudouridine synthase B [Sulfurovum sp. enrichment culture clone C5]|uniref:tRNA pseudouridine synthase B n=1 Tax=Sulfurovum sp. enrichment culture clone C5 TaxID=497650 RepID=A0A0S4XLS4_9BACT|nr:tRNA pseudouridine synthase B [Sulfurovum sp. enrichment culture clone C5]
MNLLFVANKPIFRSSNSYMNVMKRKYNTKKIGFSGTLDPFATGCLIVATGQYTKLFQFLDKTPKTYSATIWLGVKSTSLDIERVENIRDTEPLELEKIKNAITSLKGEVSYYPPQFCAKKVEGIASYKNARNGIKTDLKKIISSVYDIEMLSYNHPFISFKATVSEGSYIRSLGEIICKKLEIEGTLSSLKRINEGNFKFENEKPLNPLDFISLERNEYLKDIMDIELGKKLSLDDFKIKNSGVYLVVTNNFFSIIEIKDDNVAYKINRMPLFEG